jgi:hypothetical protein
MSAAVATVWAGVDVGMTHHWVEVVDRGGATLLSRHVLNDQAEIDELIAEIVPLADRVQWAVDIVGGPSRCCWPCLPKPISRCERLRGVGC